MAGLKVLGVVGSPRRGGNTDIMVDAILRGAEAAGAETEQIRLDALRISPCRGCYGCLASGECLQRDEMAGLLARLRESAIWVLGTPVYYSGPTAQMKIFMDRWFSAPKEIFAGRKVILAVPLGDENSAVADHLTGMFRDALDYQGAELHAVLLAPGLGLEGSIREQADLLAGAYETGRRAVELSIG